MSLIAQTGCLDLGARPSAREAQSAWVEQNLGSIASVAGAPVITASPFSRTVFLGGVERLHVDFDSESSASVAWRRNGLPLVGEAGPELVLFGHPDFAGSYEAVVSNAHGTTTSSPAVITVSPVPGDINRDGQVDATDNATFLASWGTTGGAADLNGDGRVDSRDLPILLGNWGRAPAVAELSPRIAEAPAGVTLVAGARLTLSARFYAVAGTPVQWLKDGAPLMASERVGITREFDSSTLTVESVEFSDAGEYSVRVGIDSRSVDTQTAQVQVTPEASSGLPVRLYPEPPVGGAITFHRHQNAFFEVAIDAPVPVGLTYQWYLDGRLLVDESVPPIGEHVRGSRDRVLSFSNVRAEIGTSRQVVGAWFTSVHRLSVQLREPSGRVTEAVLPAFYIDAHEDAHAVDTTVQLEAEVSASPARITVKWPQMSRSNQYQVYRKSLNDAQWTPISQPQWIMHADPFFPEYQSAVGFVDTGITVGQGYEYAVIGRNPSGTGIVRRGYLYTGIELPRVDSRGKLVLVVERTLAPILGPEIARLTADVEGDGWQVVRLDVDRHVDGNPDSCETIAGQSHCGRQVVRVRAAIQRAYQQDTINTKAVFLLGRVPVPYAGTKPITHDTYGAHPSDWFYGEMLKPVDLNCAQIPAGMSVYTYVRERAWTDCQANQSTVVTLPPPVPDRLRNVPGDGKFDQNEIPGFRAQLQVGRVDLSNMARPESQGLAFRRAGETDAQLEIRLLRRYLDKNHAYRIATFQVPSRALISDRLGAYENWPATDGWRNASPAVGPANIYSLPPTQRGLVPVLNQSPYLWVHGAGAGAFQGFNGASTDEYASQSTYGVFYTLIGSYFGDWDVQENFLRAPLAAEGYGLASTQGRLVNFFGQHLPMGFNLGYASLRSINNSWAAASPSSGYCFSATPPLYEGTLACPSLDSAPFAVPLMGDPTLRTQMVPGPSGVAAAVSGSTGARTVTLSWEPSAAAGVIYHVYRASASGGAFQRIGQTIATSYVQSAVVAGSYRYQVRALVKTVSASGSYWNNSTGMTISVSVP
ncbi:MAG: dockerin type I domain-containing protein [Bacteriovoracia bacterium]